MAVVTYKKIDGEIVCEHVPAELLEAQLAGGWKLRKSELETPITKEEADTNDSGKLSSQEIRAAAKEAGIEGYETKRIKTLEAELWPTPKAI